MAPTVLLRLDDSIRPAACATYRSFLAAFSTLFRVAGLTIDGWVSAREAVEMETPAA